MDHSDQDIPPPQLQRPVRVRGQSVYNFALTPAQLDALNFDVHTAVPRNIAESTAETREQGQIVADLMLEMFGDALPPYAQTLLYDIGPRIFVVQDDELRTLREAWYQDPEIVQHMRDADSHLKSAAIGGVFAQEGHILLLGAQDSAWEALIPTEQSRFAKLLRDYGLLDEMRPVEDTRAMYASYLRTITLVEELMHFTQDGSLPVEVNEILAKGFAVYVLDELARRTSTPVAHLIPESDDACRDVCADLQRQYATSWPPSYQPVMLRLLCGTLRGPKAAEIRDIIVPQIRARAAGLLHEGYRYTPQDHNEG